ncbi:MAG TPA: LysM peptidoglycan-binding domain-containing protein [Terriglobales bacterium]|nr:LysM peptidoglycan-binding domain-containing protein [Terriglobales bacterium]
MRISRFSILIAASAVLFGVGCQSAQKPASHLLPPSKMAPPPIQQKSQDKSVVAKSTAPEATAKANPAQVKTEAKPDPVVELIARVEKEYQVGLDQYNAGQKDAAKEHFDRAFNILLESPAELRNDPRFQPEFDRILNSVNELELTAMQQADAGPEQQAEPAPIDEANEVTNYPVDQNLKAKATAEIKATHSDLPLMMTDPVASYINYFSTRGRGTLEHGLTLSGRYREMIESILKEEGVPQDLIYLAQAESGFHPYAVSRAGARGIWQFMGSRARAYDLHRDLWIDERQDPEKSTRAAAHHLKDLYNEFGDWYLAMAAYNSGPVTIQNAVKRTGYADFWELYRRGVLPKETRNYVPIILAETIMAKNPAQYGLQDVVPDPPMKYDTVKIGYPVDLRLVAECVDATPEELQELNPSLLRMTTPQGHFDLHLPPGTTDKYDAAIAAVPPNMRLWWRYHTVESGDTLMSIARTFRTPMKAIAEANQLDVSDTIQPGAKLIVPIPPGRHNSGDVQTYARRLTVYHIRRGDTLQRVSDNLGVAPATIRRWNRIKGNSIAGRRVLYVHLPVSPTVEAEQRLAAKSHRSSRLVAENGGEPIHHTVRRGETLYSIATNYRTSVKAIKETNSNVATLRPGMVLVIPAQ